MCDDSPIKETKGVSEKKPGTGGRRDGMREQYTITGHKSEMRNGVPADDHIRFAVRADCHEQHCPNSTRLVGLSAAGLRKIREERRNGYCLAVDVGGHTVGIEND